MGSIDDISLDTILNSMQNIKHHNNLKEIDTRHHIMYPKLSHYVMIEPYNVHLLAKNDIIRYIKRSGEISCAASIVKIVKSDRNNSMYFFLTSAAKRNSVWKIYPFSYIIYRYDKYASDNQTFNNIKKMYNINEKTHKYVNVTKEQRKKILKQAGFSKKNIDLDDNIDKMLAQHTNATKCTYTNKKIINENDIDTMIDEIIKYEAKKRKNIQ